MSDPSLEGRFFSFTSRSVSLNQPPEGDVLPLPRYRETHSSTVSGRCEAVTHGDVRGVLHFEVHAIGECIASVEGTQAQRRESLS